ncbi:citrate synthase [Phenylobacterium sp.]|uniref:citrate synthase n=1 Tax=Phenylobacterium sp. TaxID=1871053 RepID=UPI0025F0BE08|nr:citrate synthase [Phenylobacterium sp.]
MPQADWIAAEVARDRLGVRAQTLYAYVSRGRVSVRPDPRDPRRSLYRAADIAALTERKSRSRKIAEVASGAINWGEPVLASEITTVSGGRLFYRGRDAIRLAETETLESVARLLRGGHGAALKRSERPRPPQGPDMRTRAFLALAGRAASDPPARGRAALALAVEAATLLDVLTDAVVGDVGGGPIHGRLAQAWGVGPGGPGADLIRRILVLVADHELNASVFAARVAASTGCSLAAAALAGIATLSGPRHGGATAAVHKFAAEAALLGPREAIAGRLTDDRALPGFGHNLYPDGDPRARALLTRFAPPEDLGRLQDAVKAVTGLDPNVDFALIAACEALKLPTDAPFALFAVARCAGWIAHAIEQGQADTLIRPRARYIGPEPEAI